MKKIFCIMMAALLVIPAMAADRLTPEERATRDYSSWLPAAGDFSLGFSLDPLASFIGNAFNGTMGNGLDDFAGEALRTNQVSIMGAYMLTDNLSLRANLGWNFAFDKAQVYSQDDAAVFFDPFSGSKVIDTHRQNVNGGSFALGVDYRAGKRAVQGVFGGGLIYGLSSVKETYSYGNAITELNQTPTMGFGSYAPIAYLSNARPLERYSAGLEHFFGLYGSIGVEWFVAPKIALGANVNVQLIYTLGAQDYAVYEGWNTVTEVREEYTNLVSPGHRGFVFSTDNIGANLYAAFYF